MSLLVPLQVILAVALCARLQCVAAAARAHSLQNSELVGASLDQQRPARRLGCAALRVRRLRHHLVHTRSRSFYIHLHCLFINRSIHTQLTLIHAFFINLNYIIGMLFQFDSLTIFLSYYCQANSNLF